MSKLLLIGSASLPNNPSGIRNAASLRTWQFLQSIPRGHEICLVTIDEKGDAIYQEDTDGIEHYTIPKSRNTIQDIQNIHDTFQPDILVGVNNYPSFLAASLQTTALLWADLNGWVMSEGLEQSKREESDAFMSHLWQREKTILQKADHISTVSAPQKYAITGELMALGRAHKENDPETMVSVIPNATEAFEIDLVQSEEAMIRGKLVPEDAFIISFIGGYNTWVDEEVLFMSLIKAMEQNPNIYFVSTGGKIEHVSDTPFTRFQKNIEMSFYKDRFVFLGWVDTKDMAQIYLESNCGINVDRMCLETTTGARNRINEMLKFELPVITTLGSEIAFELQKYDAGLTAPSGDAETLAQHMLDLAQDIELQGHYKQRAREYFEKRCSYKFANAPFVSWLLAPRRSSKKNIAINRGSKIKQAHLYLKKSGVKGFVKKLWKG